MLQQSLKTLGLPSTADLTQIKQAYRKKAKQFHPDRNPAPEAHEQFLALSEAYDYLVAYKSGSYRSRSRGRRKYPPKGSRQEQEASQREESRKRAEEYAKMKFEAYKKTEHYKDSLALVVATRFATLLTSIFLLVVLPLLAWYKMGSTGQVVTFIIVIFSMPVWLDVVRKPSKYIETTDFLEAMGRVVRFEGFQVVASLLVNGFIFLTIGLNTLISVSTQLKAMLLFGGLGFLLSIVKRFRIFRPFLTLGLGPFMITSVLLVNYVGAHTPIGESYGYKVILQQDENGQLNRDIPITLENETYDEYLGIRFFLNTSEVNKHRKISYIFEEGFFGWRVMTDYKFIR